jgi:ankyrin repeat protein
MSRLLHVLMLAVLLALCQGRVWANCPETKADKKGAFDQLLEKARHGDVLSAKDAIGKGLSPDTKNGCDGSLLLISAATGNLELVTFLISVHADVNIRNWEGATPLAAAAMAGQTGIVKVLLEHGANPNLAFSSSDAVLGTPLLLAASNNHLDIVQMLLAHGADPCWKNSTGENTDSRVYRDPRVDAPIRDAVDDAAVSKHCGVTST